MTWEDDRRADTRGMRAPLISLPEAAAILGVSASTMRRLIESGAVPTVRLTPRSHQRIDLADLDRVIEAAKRPHAPLNDDGPLPGEPHVRAVARVESTGHERS